MLKVLLEEDNPIYREVFKEDLLKRFQALAIEEAGDGAEALRKINATPPDLVFMDIRLPRMNGLQLTQGIKRISPTFPLFS